MDLHGIFKIDKSRALDSFGVKLQQEDVSLYGVVKGALDQQEQRTWLNLGFSFANPFIASSLYESTSEEACGGNVGRAMGALPLPKRSCA